MRTFRIGFGAGISEGFDNGRGEKYCDHHGSGMGGGGVYFRGNFSKLKTEVFCENGNGHGNYQYILIQYWN